MSYAEYLPPGLMHLQSFTVPQPGGPVIAAKLQSGLDVDDLLPAVYETFSAFLRTLFYVYVEGEGRGGENFQPIDKYL